MSCPVKISAFLHLLILTKARQSSEQYVRIGGWSGVLDGWSGYDSDRPRRLVGFAPPLVRSAASEVQLEQSAPSNAKIEGSRESSNTNFHISWAGCEHDTSIARRPNEQLLVSTGAVQDCSIKRRRGRRRRHEQVVPHEETIEPLGVSVDDTTATSYNQERARLTLTLPLMERKGWESLRGDEFLTDHDGSLLDAFALICQQVCTTEASDWIDWKPKGKHGDLEDGAINVWVGRAVDRGRESGGGKDDDEYCGGHLPIIKSQSIVPLTPVELAELLLDSSRVQTYNKWSLGRRDIWVHPDPDRRAKVVKNRTKPPVGSKPLVSTTLMHARMVSLDSTLPTSAASSFSNTDSWIVVSRAIGGTLYCEDADADCGRSDILLGVNLLQPVGDDSSLVTAITHVQSTIVPAMLAESLGVKGAIQFVHDLRRLRTKVPA
jgi:hypothetical protein